MSSHEFLEIPPRETNVEDDVRRSAPRHYDARGHNREPGSVGFLGSPDKTCGNGPIPMHDGTLSAVGMTIRGEPAFRARINRATTLYPVGSGPEP